MTRVIKVCFIALLAIILPLCSFTGCKSRGGDSFGFTIVDEPKQIDPQVADDTASLAVITAAFEGLARMDETGKIVPGAADWTVSEDGCTYTFKLKTSCWSTVSVRGEETGFEDPIMVTAHDFVFGIRRTADPATVSPHASMLLGIENADAVIAGEKPLSALGVKATDDQTLVITLVSPDPDFPEKLTTPGFMPCNSEFFTYAAGRYGLETRYILTNGAFYVSGWEHDVSITLRKNEEYHAAQEVLPASVKYRVTVSEQEDFELLTKGNLDAAFIPESQVEAAKDAGIQLVGMQDTVQYLWMNNSVPALQNADIRKALCHAIEWDVLRQSLSTAFSPAAGFVSPAATVGGETYRKDADTLPFKTDAAAASALLQKGLQTIGAQSAPTLTLLAAEDGESADLARYILQSFSKNLSLYCTLELVDAGTLAARVRAGNYELAVYAVTGTGLTAKENLETFTADAPAGNYARYASSAYDALYADAKDDRGSIERLEKHLLENCPALPLGFYTRYYGVQSNSTGIVVRPFNGGAFGATVSFREAEITE